MRRVLILGGTGEAAELARAAAPDVEVISSLAGVAAVPDLPGRTRVGGFGGPDGLADYLRSEAIDAVVDATHPFAARISAHAVAACAATGVPLLRLERQAWERQPGDRWTLAADAAEAARRLPGLGKRAFVTVGAKELDAFLGLGVWVLARLLQPRDIADGVVVVGRGPFTVEGETALMRQHRIEVLVTKASGGGATRAKLDAARALGVPVLMIGRPAAAAARTVHSVQAALDWLT